MDPRVERIKTASSYVSGIIGDRKPIAGIVLGSGLGRLADMIEDAIVIPYKEIPGFPVSTSLGHKGNFIVGRLSGKTVIAMQGRIHYYEGYSMDLVTLPVRVMHELGARYLFVSNAAGGTNLYFNVGDLMIIRDHINLMPNPLVGPYNPELGSRFPDMTCPYDLELIGKAGEIAAKNNIPLRMGVYAAGTGPSYETPAEVRYLSLIGADAVGMSTVPEVIVARQCEMRVFGMSVITNKSNWDNLSTTLNDGDDVVRAADAAAAKMATLFSNLIGSLQ